MKHFQPDILMNKILITLILIFQCHFLSAQITTISTMEICAGQEVLLPVNGEALLNVGALTIYVGFDTINLTFLNVENIDPQLDGMSVNLMTTPTQLAFAWSSTNPIQFSNSKLFDIKFLSNGQSADVQFNTGCELSDTGGFVIPVTYINGEINSGVPVILFHSGDTTVVEGGKANFSVQSPNTSYFLWRESTDNGGSWLALDDNEIYSGSHTDSLTISGVPFSFNNNLYQCILYNGLCQSTSEPSLLSVDELSGVSIVTNLNRSSFLVTPVPFHDFCNVEFIMAQQGDFQMQVVNLLGQIIDDIKSPSLAAGYHYIRLNTSDWESGVYFFHIQFSFSGVEYRNLKKIVRK